MGRIKGLKKKYELYRLYMLDEPVKQDYILFYSYKNKAELLYAKKYLSNKNPEYSYVAVIDNKIVGDKNDLENNLFSM